MRLWVYQVGGAQYLFATLEAIEECSKKIKAFSYTQCSVISLPRLPWSSHFAVANVSGTLY